GADRRGGELVRRRVRAGGGTQAPARIPAHRTRWPGCPGGPRRGPTPASILSGGRASGICVATGSRGPACTGRVLPGTDAAFGPPGGCLPRVVSRSGNRTSVVSG